MRRIPIRVKLAAALAVPLFAMGVVTVIEVLSVADDAREVREQTELATATIGSDGLITALQNERNWASAYLVGFHEQLALEVTGFEGTRADTNAALAEFESELDRRGPAARAAYGPALDNLAQMAALREQIDGYVETSVIDISNMPLTTEVFDGYTALIEPFFGGMSRISVAMDDPELRQGASLMETVTRQLETVPQLANALVLPATVPTAEGDESGINSPTEIAELAELHDAFRRQAEELRTVGGPYAQVAEEQYPEQFTTLLDEQTAQGLETGQVDTLALVEGLATTTEGSDDPDAVEDASQELAYISYRNAVGDTLQERADELNASAASRQRWFALLMLGTFAAAVVLTILVSLSITRPLRSLTRQAKEMAERRLPNAVADVLDTPLGDDVIVPSVAMVRVNTRDEVSDVAQALNTVQDSALDLAVEQAVLRRNIADSFVNLGRRNQNLLGRQLDFITELESNETDPDALAALFRLDHLATRMRRNAESLLVLAGIEPPRQWAAPVPLGDVIRAALGEVENYQRVTIRSVAPATILGSAAADLAHLLAELVENALAFSPPDRAVEIRGLRRPPHDSVRPGGYALAVVDTGLGMSPQDIEAANRRLAGVESFTVAPSKYLGHYVAGNLAARHGIGVQLHSAHGSGVTATVELPPAILTSGAEALPDLPVLQQGPASPAAPQPGPAPAPHYPAPTWQEGPAPAPPQHAPAPAWPQGAPAPAWQEGPVPPRAPAPARTPVAPAPPAPSPGAPPLARRDRGAQLPTTTVRRLHGDEEVAAPARRPPQSADDFYDFLSSFTAGVQRGLDSARHGQGPPA